MRTFLVCRTAWSHFISRNLGYHINLIANVNTLNFGPCSTKINLNLVNSFFNMYDFLNLYEFWFYLYVYWTAVFLFVVDRDLDNHSSLSYMYYNEPLSIWHAMGADKTVDLSAF